MLYSNLIALSLQCLSFWFQSILCIFCLMELVSLGISIIIYAQLPEFSSALALYPRHVELSCSQPCQCL